MAEERNGDIYPANLIKESVELQPLVHVIAQLSSDLTVEGLKVKNSPQFHVKFDGCHNILTKSRTIKAPASSPNTDEIHIENTNNVQIYNSIISNGCYMMLTYKT